MSRWTDIGYKWNTETTCRVREFLQGNRIPFRMPFDEMYFQSMYHLPHRDRIWGIQVRRKDLTRVLSLLGKEGIIRSPAPRARETPKREPAGFRRQRARLFPTALRKGWPTPRPGTGNT